MLLFAHFCILFMCIQEKAKELQRKRYEEMKRGGGGSGKIGSSYGYGSGGGGGGYQPPPPMGESLPSRTSQVGVVGASIYIIFLSFFFFLSDFIFKKTLVVGGSIFFFFWGTLFSRKLYLKNFKAKYYLQAMGNYEFYTFFFFFVQC